MTDSRIKHYISDGTGRDSYIKLNENIFFFLIT